GLSKERLAHVETDEIKYLLFDFANKIILLTRCSVFKDQNFILSYFVSPPRLSGDLNNISRLPHLCNTFFSGEFFNQFYFVFVLLTIL
ncbi:hypothetical protein C1I59_18685, partial [Paenibacillus polymyxa]|uniref:hypothetical protein n=1 Tax=Paenibacillus polymyxa TaxID=1406 RepID=UPI00113A7767